MPAYFKFMTILFLHIALEERVDAVILEVGIGGELDCTNVIRNTEFVGISSLGLEHTQLLGDTLEEIAWQKAGIIKANAEVYTSVSQPECLKMIKERVSEKNAKSFHRVTDFAKYFEASGKNKASLLQQNDITRLNGSLAIQLAHAWLRRHGNKAHDAEYSLNSGKLSETTLQGLCNCSWPGRCQMIKLQNYK